MAFFKLMWKPNSKHEKLSEELVFKNSKRTKQEDAVDGLSNENDTVTFKLKYIGSTVVKKMGGENVSSEAVKTIIKTAKEMKKKTFPTVNVKISLQGITVIDSQGDDTLKISIYSISNCSTDASHRQIFSFISSDSSPNSTCHKCHAFLCSKRKIAQDVTLAVASAFNTAYQAWSQLSLSNEAMKNLVQSKENEKNNLNQINMSEVTKEERLIDLDSAPLTEEDLLNLESRSHSNTTKSQWVSFDDDYVMDSFNYKFQQ